MEWFKASKLNIQKRRVSIFGGPEKLKCVDAGKQLQRRHLMKLTIDHGQPTNSTTYMQPHDTLQIQKVVIGHSFSMQPWIPTLIPLWEQQCPSRFLSLFCCSKGTAEYRNVDSYFFWHDSTWAQAFLSSQLCPRRMDSLSHVILQYATLIPALLHLRTSININKRIQKVTIPVDTGDTKILGEWFVKGLWNSWIL